MITLNIKTIYKYLLGSAFLLLLAGCEGEWLERDPNDIITEEQVWNDPVLIDGLLANYYDRLPKHYSLVDGPGEPDYLTDNWREMAMYTDAMWSGGSNDQWRNDVPTYDFSRWALWDYKLIRDLNLAIENIDEYSTQLQDAEKTAYKAELRFLRAYVYFEHVKRMGGVPLITETMEYTGPGDVEELQYTRATEQEVYDFVYNELEAIKDQLGNDGSNSRANKYTALALQSRAMLYAGSIARYNNEMANPITTPGGEVGIPAAAAQDYYEKALLAAEDVIQNSPYTLYENNPDPADNFYEAVNVDNQNSEMILAEHYLSSADKRHWFAYDNIARPIREDNLGSSAITPSLNLVEAFPYVDGSPGELQTRTADGSDYIYYDNVMDIFADKDPRLFGTVIVPGGTFKGSTIEMQAGVKVWNGSEYETEFGSQLSTEYEDGGVLTAAGGPHQSITEVSNTGFYMKKLIDSDPMSSSRGVRSDNWWPMIRLAEVYLNAAEAAYELSQMGGAATPQEAADYINELRERAGFDPAGLLTGTTIDMETIRNERRVELAFEDHRIWDLKRWRIAHEVWDGQSSNEEAIVRALYPYRVVNPGSPNHNKYVFEEVEAPRMQNPRQFRMGNYYSAIPQDVRNRNPKLVRNPFH